MNALTHLEATAAQFVAAIESLNAELFLAPIDDWTPRDVTALLAWWNNHMLVACRDLERGTAPSYYADTLNDYRNLNARAIAQFQSQEQRMLLAQLKATLFEFKQYLLALDASDWDAERGVTHPRGGTATITCIVESLASDYETHTREIREWQAK
jgi:hypothetical protein